MIIVIDASVAAKWFFQEEHSMSALNLLDNHFELNVPDFFFLEMNSLLCKRTRRRELSITEALEMDDEIISIPIQSYASAALREKAFEIALEAKCSIYDCLYLALAESLGVCMVTADKKFFQAIENGPLSHRMLWVEDVDLAKG
jgi:predicted nucleic acid-binding protein